MPSSFSLQKFISKPRLPPSLSSTSNERTNNHAAPFLWQCWWGSPPLLPSTTPRAEEEAGAPLFNPSHPTKGRTPNCYTECTHSKRPPSLSLFMQQEEGETAEIQFGTERGGGRRRRNIFFLRFLLLVRHLSYLHFPCLEFFSISARVPKRTRADPNNSGWHAPDFPSKRRQEDFSPPPLWPFPAKAKRRACCCRATVEEDREGGEIDTTVPGIHWRLCVCVCLATTVLPPTPKHKKNPLLEREKRSVYSVYTPPPDERPPPTLLWALIPPMCVRQ